VVDECDDEGADFRHAIPGKITQIEDLGPVAGVINVTGWAQRRFVMPGLSPGEIVERGGGGLAIGWTPTKQKRRGCKHGNPRFARVTGVASGC
jgi:hypothetical protein